MKVDEVVKVTYPVPELMVSLVGSTAEPSDLTMPGVVKGQAALSLVVAQVLVIPRISFVPGFLCSV